MNMKAILSGLVLVLAGAAAHAGCADFAKAATDAVEARLKEQGTFCALSATAEPGKNNVYRVSASSCATEGAFVFRVHVTPELEGANCTTKILGETGD